MAGWFSGRPAARRASEATTQQIVATGAGYGYGVDPVDGDRGFRPMGQARRDVPQWTLERARTHAIAAYRCNPMAAAIVDTITAFAVGDSGVSPTVTNPKVQELVADFWDDPRNALGHIQEVSLRSQILWGEMGWKLLVGPQSGVVRLAPIDPILVQDVELHHGNPLWPSKLIFAPDGTGEGRPSLTIAQVDDVSRLRDGEAMWWAPWRTLLTDRRGMPLITSVLDWLDSYDQVLSNLIDRTALARYLVWDVTVEGDDEDVKDFVRARGGLHIPPSGSVEVHNDEVKWEPRTVTTGAIEDTKANGAVLTNIAAGTGLAKTWLADPEDSNKATSQSMAEPVRRRVGAVQKVWLAQQTELVRFAVDRAVASGRLPRMVEAADPKTGLVTEVAASKCVIVTGPEIAAADSQIAAQVMLNLATGLEKLVMIGALSKESAGLAARKGWEDYMGVPYRAELDKPDPGQVQAAAAAALGEDKPVSPGVAGPAKPAPEAVQEAENSLKRYWLAGEGLARWATWTQLYGHLKDHMPAEKAKAVAAAWFHERYGIWPGHQRGDNPRGPESAVPAAAGEGRHSFDPSQPRDGDGRWSDGPGGASSATRARPGSFAVRVRQARSRDAALAAPPLSLVRGDRLAGGQRAGLEAYQEHHYRPINRTLRDPAAAAGASNAAEVREWIAGMDSAMAESRLPAEITTMRGITRAQRMFGDRWDGDLTGMEWREDAYVSTTTHDEVAASFAGTNVGAVRMRLIVPAGIGAIEMSRSPGVDPDEGEAEVLLERGLRMRVVADRGHAADGVREIDVEVVPGS